MIFLDTNIISYYLNTNKMIIDNLMQLIDKNEILCTTVINKYEIIRGFMWKKNKIKENLARGFLSNLMIYPIDDEVIEIASVIYSYLRKISKPAEDTDILIAAVVIANDGTLITNNTKHFENITDLKIENWV